MIKVSSNGRYLVDAFGKPWLYLADTAWMLFHRLTREQADLYLQTRASQGYTVIQASLLSELDGLRTPNAYGHLPLYDLNPAKPCEAYMAHADWIVRRANELGLVMAILPTWGDKWNHNWGSGPEIFTADSALAWGRYLGERYRNDDIIWILGGDRAIETYRHAAVIRRMSEGLAAGDGKCHLQTFHSKGLQSSSHYFPCDAWCDFNMYQTGHVRDRDNYRMIGQDYQRTPVKPCLDGEPGYENIPHDFKLENGRLDAHQVRKFAYWALFSGACGHTYGCNDIWQFWNPGRDPVLFANTAWQKALEFPGGRQVAYVRKLIEAVRHFERIPAPELLYSNARDGPGHIQICRDPHGCNILAYLPLGGNLAINTSAMSSDLCVQWFNPREGIFVPQDSTVAGGGIVSFTSPAEGTDDWVLWLQATSMS